MLPSPSNYSLPQPPRLSHAHTNKIKKANDAPFGSLVSTSLPPLSHTHFNLCTHTSTPKINSFSPFPHNSKLSMTPTPFIFP